MSFTPFSILVDLAINGVHLTGWNLVFFLTLFFKLTLMFVPFLLLNQISFSGFYKYFLEEQLPWFDSKLNNIFKKAD